MDEFVSLVNQVMDEESAIADDPEQHAVLPASRPETSSPALQATVAEEEPEGIERVEKDGAPPEDPVEHEQEPLPDDVPAPEQPETPQAEVTERPSEPVESDDIPFPESEPEATEWFHGQENEPEQVEDVPTRKDATPRHEPEWSEVVEFDAPTFEEPETDWMGMMQDEQGWQAALVDRANS